MIPHVVKGSDMPGLLGYLVGAGRANEHTNPHVISGDGFVQAWHGTQELGHSDALAIAAYLDEPRRLYGTEIMSKVWAHSETGERIPVLDATGAQLWKDQSVWHCSLSLAPGEKLSDEQWDGLARQFMDEMGMTEASGKSPCRWVAIQHGASKGGNDHVHIAATMVREDGTRWDGRFRDFPQAQRAARRLEQDFGLVKVQGREFGTATPGLTPAELRRQAAGQLGRDDLAQRLRAAAVASQSEAEWVHRVRGSGVVLKPWFAPGSTDVVAGYRAALRNPAGRLNFYGGGRLGNDLSLPRIRENWAEPSIEQAAAASAEWQAAFRGQRSPGSGRSRDQLAPTAPQVAAARLSAFSARLGRTPVTDRQAWARAARDMSGALSAWAQFDPANASQLRAAAAAIARTAQDRRPGEGRGRRPADSAMGAALVFLAASGDQKPAIAAAAVMTAMLQAAAALREYHRETGNLAEARRVREAIRQLRTVQLDGYAKPVERRGETSRRRGATPPAGDRGPLPAQLSPKAAAAVRTAPSARERGSDERDR